MLQRLFQLKEAQTLRQFIKFGMVGVLNTIAHAAVYYAVSRGLDWPPLVANAAAFVVAVTLSFTINRRWTFRSQAHGLRSQYVKFMIISLAGFGWSELLLYVAHYKFGWHDLIALAFAVAVVLFWNFTLNKLWTFRRSSSLV